MGRETLKFWNLVRLILETLRYMLMFYWDAIDYPCLDINDG